MLPLASCDAPTADDSMGFSDTLSDRKAAGGSASAKLGDHCEGTPDCQKGLLCAATRRCGQLKLLSCSDGLTCRDKCVGEGCVGRCRTGSPLRVAPLFDAIDECLASACATDCERGRCAQCRLDAQAERCDSSASACGQCLAARRACADDVAP
jgi:hypothetical protein